MPRPRKTNRHLPAGMYQRSGTYYHVTGGRWVNLGRDFADALAKYAAANRGEHVLRTVGDAITAYLADAAGRLKPATLDGYRISAGRLVPVFGHMMLGAVTAAHVYRYVSRDGRVRSNRDKALLSAAYSYARRMGAFDGIDPTKGLQWRNKEAPRNRYISDAEFDTLTLAASPRLACMMRVSYLTGMRLGDVLRLKWADIDAEGISYAAGKTGKRAVVLWSDALREAIADSRRLARSEAVYVFEGRSKRTGRWAGYTPGGVKAMFRRVKIKAGLPDVTFHDLRRKAGSDVEAGHATELLQHGDARITRKHYRAKPERIKPTR
jgi:integrase